jgi:succinyl-diaminopimelate desuccinylase
MSTLAPNPVALAAQLIRCASVTPADAGALDVLEHALAAIGFSCERMRFGEIDNLWARFGTAKPHFCFAGHTDVVPAGDVGAWSRPPFAGAIEGGVLFGRGAADMKGAIAAFAAAAGRAVAAGAVTGSLSLMITGDEEGVAEDGTKAMVRALAERGEAIDHCLVGEPTSAAVLGDMVKIGRRGSINAAITVHGVQGHVAYPDRAANPAPVLVRLLTRLIERRLDDGFEAFQPSNLEITSIDIGNPAANVIPARASARINIRFNPTHTGAGLQAWIEEEARLAETGFRGKVEVEAHISGEAFLTRPGRFTQMVSDAVTAQTGRAPELSTTGGTSDARFIRALCEVAEFGLVGATMHQVDEQASLVDIRALADLYERLIGDYFAAFS